MATERLLPALQCTRHLRESGRVWERSRCKGLRMLNRFGPSDLGNVIMHSQARLQEWSPMPKMLTGRLFRLSLVRWVFAPGPPLLSSRFGLSDPKQDLDEQTGNRRPNRPCPAPPKFGSPRGCRVWSSGFGEEAQRILKEGPRTRSRGWIRSLRESEQGRKPPPKHIKVPCLFFLAFSRDEFPIESRG